MDTIKAFLSYSTDDKQVAGKVKEQLANWGIDAFLAHEDLKPTAEWETRIMEEVRSCDVFIPLLTGSFILSEWTDQESGMAIAESRVVMPFEVTRDPHGFLKKYQAHRIGSDASTMSFRDIFLGMKSNQKLEAKTQNSFIQGFVNSKNYSEAISKSEMLEALGPYNPSQVNEIIAGSLKNSQVYGAYTVVPKLKDFFSKNEQFVDPTLKKRLVEMLGN